MDGWATAWLFDMVATVRLLSPKGTKFRKEERKERSMGKRREGGKIKRA